MEIRKPYRTCPRLFLACFTTILLVAGARTAFDAERDWGNTGTDFNVSGSWSGGIAPGAGDVAWFKVAKSTDPNLSASVSIAGLYFGGGGGTSSSGYHITSSSGSIKLTLTGLAPTTGGAEGSNGSAAAIGADNIFGTNTIDAPIVLGASPNSIQTFYQAGGGTLIV